MNETLLVLEMMDAIHHQIQSLISRKIIESPYEPDYYQIGFLFDKQEKMIGILKKLLIDGDERELEQENPYEYQKNQ